MKKPLFTTGNVTASCGSRDGSCSRVYVLPYGTLKRNRRRTSEVKNIGSGNKAVKA